MESHAKVAVYSCLVNALLASAKYGLGDISGSLALKADAVHSLGDVISSLTVFLGIIMSGRKTKTFPEGLYKVENLAALFSAFFILYAAYEIGSQALGHGAVDELRQIPIVAAGICGMMLVAFLFSRYELRVGLGVGSPSLVADAKHVTTDLMSSLVILVGIAGTYAGIPLDRYAALAVAVIVVRMGLEILIDAAKVLLDATLDQGTLDGIRRTLESHPHVREIISIGGRSSGRFKFVEIALTTDLRLLEEAHEVASQLEEEILDQWPNIDKILIHYEPEPRQSILLAVPLDPPEGSSPGEDTQISDHFGHAPYFALVNLNLEDRNATVREFLPNPYRDEERRKGIKAAQMLAEHEVEQVRCRKELDGTGAGYALEAMQIDVMLTKAVTLKELVTELEQSQ